MDVTDRKSDEERLRLLAREVDHRAEYTVAKNRLDGFTLGKIEPVKAELPKLPQDREPGFLERRIVIGIDAVDTNHRATGLQDAARQAEADKARGPGDQNWTARHRIPSRHPFARSGLLARRMATRLRFSLAVEP